MIPNLSVFVQSLNDGKGFAALKAAFFVLQNECNIGLVKAINNDEVKTILDNSPFDDKVYLFKNEKEISLYIYKKKNDKEWNKEDIQTLLDIGFTYYQNEVMKELLNNSRYISFTTNLPNAFGFNKIITEKFSKEELIDNYSVLSINLRGFSQINRLYNTHYGDQAIKDVAKELRKLVKEGEVLCHRGADNFLILLKNERVEEMMKLVSPIHINLRNKNDNSDKFFSLYSTFAIVRIDKEFHDFDDYISDAMVSMSYAKSHRIPVVYSNKELKNAIALSKDIELSIEDELKVQNVVVYYQPKVDIRNGKIIGAEALARWNRNGDIIYPDVFIPILEKTGDIAKLDLFMLENACKDLSAYRALGHDTVPLSVNISQKDLLSAGFYQRIVEIIKKYKLSYNDIIVEVTETTTLEEKERMNEFIEYLHRHHIKTSLDDFGTGYSSLSLLRDLKVNEVKIDRSFLDHIPLRKKDKTIIKSIIVMARKLHVDVICEGVETLEQLEYLKSIGCYHVQGYYFDKPLPKLEFEARLKERYYDRDIYKNN